MSVKKTQNHCVQNHSVVDLDLEFPFSLTIKHGLRKHCCFIGCFFLFLCYKLLQPCQTLITLPLYYLVWWLCLQVPVAPCAKLSTFFLKPVVCVRRTELQVWIFATSIDHVKRRILNMSVTSTAPLAWWEVDESGG